MEGLVILLITMAVGFLFKDKDSDVKKQKRSNPKQSNSGRTLGDFMKEVTDQLNEKYPETSKKVQEKAKDLVLEQRESAQQVKRQVLTIAEQQPLKVERAVLATTAPTKKREEATVKVKVPKTANDLAQAFLMAELLGPPKAKQNRFKK